MESSEIVRRNEAIARFMGWVYVEESEEQWAGYKADGMEREFYMVESLCFHTEWSWLMPVYEKILSYKNDWALAGSAHKNGAFKTVLGGGIKGVASTLIEATFLAVSEYCLALEEQKS